MENMNIEEHDVEDSKQAPSDPTLLSAVEVRVLGSLMEKEMTTPEYYPLTLNALVNACNQKSNRDPVMMLTESAVEQALESLRFTHRLVALVHTSGSRSQKFKHTVPDRYALGREAIALLCELFLRGPETMGEMRGRASRLHPFESLEDVERALEDLLRYASGPMVTKLPRESGRREPRYMHVLSGTPDPAAYAAAEVQTAAAPDPSSSQLAALEAEVQALRKDVEEIKNAFAEFKRQFE